MGEVTHCGGSTFETHASWFYVARGSSVFVNVGRTISFNDHVDAVRYFLGDGYCRPGVGIDGCCGEAENQCNQEIEEMLPEAARAAGFTSIQFVHHCDLYCEDPLQVLGPDGTHPGCSHELMLVQTTPNGEALGTGGDRVCPTGIEFRTGVNASVHCQCAE